MGSDTELGAGRARPSDDLPVPVRGIMEALGEVVYLTDSENRSLYLSPAFERIWGRPREELLVNPTAWVDWVHPDDRERLVGAAARAEGSYDLTYRILRPDGSVRWLNTRSYPVRDEGGALTSITGVTRDITEEMEAKASLEMSEARYRGLVEQVSEGIFEMDLDGALLVANSRVAALLGFGSVAELLSAGVDLRDLAFDPRRSAAMFEELRVTGSIEDRECTLRRRDGSHVGVRISAQVVEAEADRATARGRMVDLTSERVARHTAEDLISLIHASKDGFGLADLQGEATYLNPAARAIFGLAEDEPTSMSALMTERAWEEWTARRMPEVLEHDRTMFETTVRHVVTGEEIPVELEAFLLRDALTGNPSQLAGVFRDIRERRKAEEALVAGQRLLGAIVADLREAIVVIGADGVVRYASPSVERLAGYDPSGAGEDQGGGPRNAFASIAEVLAPEDRAAAADYLGRLLGGQTEGEPPVVLQAKRADGSWMWIEATAKAALDDPAVQGIVVTLRDVTEERRAREENDRLLRRLIESEDAERRRLASGLHDDAIQEMTYVALTLEKLAAGADADQERLAALQEKVRATIKGLREMVFELVPSSLDQGGLEAALAELLERVAEDDVVTELHVELPREPADVHRAIVYRIAREALANVRKHARATAVRVALASEAEGLRCTIVDDGIGIEGEPVSEPGHLGLVDVRERARLAGGWFRIDGRGGHGTTVDFWIPEGSAG